MTSLAPPPAPRPEPATRRLTPPTTVRDPLIVVLAAAVTMMSRLWEGDLYRDEVLYAAVAKCIITGGNWLSLMIGDTPYWRKPPLMFWATAGLYEAFGISVFTAKLTSALCGVLSCVVLYFVARRLFNARVALIAGVVLATTPRFARTAATFRLDPAVTLFTLLSVYYYIRAVAEPRWRHFVAAGCAWGLAVMTKGAFGIIGPFVVGIYLLVQRQLRIIRTPGFAVSVLVAAAVCLPWHVYQVVHWGTDFLGTYLGQEVIDRMTGELWGGEIPDTFAGYGVDFVKDAWPWLVFMVTGLFYAAARARQGNRSALFVLCWVVGYMALLYVSQGRRARYLLQVYPPLAILAALVIDRLLDRVLPERWAPRVPRAIATAFAAAATVLVLLPIPLHSEAARGLRELRPIVALVSPDPAVPLSGFRTRGLELRASSIFYLDRDLHVRGVGELRRDPGVIVLTEVEHRRRLRRKGFEPIAREDEYVLMRAPEDEGEPEAHPAPAL